MYNASKQYLLYTFKISSLYKSPHIWRVAVNILNKWLQTADKR